VWQEPNETRLKHREHDEPVIKSDEGKKRSKLTAARREALREALLEVFDAFDVDRWGSADPDEFRSIGQACTGRKWTNKEAKAAMIAVDTDGSGKIEADEFIVYFVAIVHGDAARSERQRSTS